MEQGHLWQASAVDLMAPSTATQQFASTPAFLAEVEADLLADSD